MTQRLTAQSVLVLGLATVITAAAVYFAVAAWRMGSPGTPRFTHVVKPSPQVAQQPDPFAALLQGGKPGELLMTAGAKPLDANPADLPDPPAGKRLLGYRMTTDDLVQEVAVWTIDNAQTEDLAALYGNAAVAGGFGPPAVRRADEGALTHVYPAGTRILTLRFAPRGSAVRMVMHLRYTIENSSAEGDAGDPHNP